MFKIRRPKSKIYEYIEVVVTAFILAMIVRTFVIQAFKIPSRSMVPTLRVGDHLFVCKFIYGIPIPFTDKKVFEFHSPKRGDIIVFKCPTDLKKDYIKRVIGLPGDEIMIRNKQVYINGKPIKEPYKIHSSLRTFLADSPRDNWKEPKKVPKDCYFMLGDNRDDSTDSRFWGFLEKRLIKGKAIFIYWPPNRIEIIR
ncbi:MAG: signal peptidase I [bacterium]|nr:signal peptidase I [bacterium]